MVQKVKVPFIRKSKPALNWLVPMRIIHIGSSMYKIHQWLSVGVIWQAKWVIESMKVLTQRDLLDGGLPSIAFLSCSNIMCMRRNQAFIFAKSSSLCRSSSSWKSSSSKAPSEHSLRGRGVRQKSDPRVRWIYPFHKKKDRAFSMVNPLFYWCTGGFWYITWYPPSRWSYVAAMVCQICAAHDHLPQM